jgi:hypothetical protein
MRERSFVVVGEGCSVHVRSPSSAPFPAWRSERRSEILELFNVEPSLTHMSIISSIARRTMMSSPPPPKETRKVLEGIFGV